MMTTDDVRLQRRSSTAPDVLRSRNRKRDDAIRKKVEQELSRKTGRRGHRESTTSRRIKSGTVSSLRPAPAIIILETARIVQAAQLMAAKRADAVLAVNEDGALVGILTDKDIAYRVVAEGLDVRTTLVSAIMTRNPISVYDKGSRNEALNIMVSRRFRHLPVISDGPGGPEDDMDDDTLSEMGAGTSVVGLLDITKCVFERLDDLERKVNEDQNIISAMEALERRGSVASEHVGIMRAQHGCPDVGTVLSQMQVEHVDDIVPEIGIKATVRDAARVMKQNHQTAVLVSAGEMDERIGGIFTTKDIVLRVLAASLDPGTTSVVRVMTPHPDSVASDTSILDALKKLHAGHYLHLPVVEAGAPIGLVDVMTLTISMLTYLMTKDGASADASAESGPMWNRFWNSTFAASTVGGETESDRHSVHSDSITGSVVSHNTYPIPPPPAPSERGSVTSSHAGPAPPKPLPNTSPYPYDRHHNGSPMPPRDAPVENQSPSTYSRSIVDEGLFAFKLRDARTGKVYRFTSRTDSLDLLTEKVVQKCGSQEAMKLSYVDDEGDIISLSNDKDLEEGVEMARGAGWKRLLIFVGEVDVHSLHRHGMDVDDSASSVSSSPALRKKMVRSVSGEVFGGGGEEEGKEMVVREGREVVRREEGEIMRFLREAPLPINVGISAAIVMIFGVIFVRLIR